MPEEQARLFESMNTWVDRHIAQLKEAGMAALLPAKNDPPGERPLWNTHFLRLDLAETSAGSGTLVIEGGRLVPLGEMRECFGSEEARLASMKEDRDQFDVLEKTFKTKVYGLYVVTWCGGLPNMIPTGVREETMREHKSKNRDDSWLETLKLVAKPGTQLWMGPGRSIVATVEGDR
ncbi:hypothetical protein FRB90_011934 [Tulasnella sp. 427]|nr:hypothetical protein FRB90_011934 [Tulasnella sp. 427]